MASPRNQGSPGFHSPEQLMRLWIIAGDFNEDIRGKSISAWLARGLRSVLGNEHVPTWRWTLENRELTWQLDHILVNDKIIVEAARVIQAGGSDHLPIIATLRIRPEEATTP